MPMLHIESIVDIFIWVEPKFHRPSNGIGLRPKYAQIQWGALKKLTSGICQDDIVRF
jgi:hypothetical protein